MIRNIRAVTRIHKGVTVLMTIKIYQYLKSSEDTDDFKY